jgi:hypothetical protein
VTVEEYPRFGRYLMAGVPCYYPVPFPLALWVTGPGMTMV